MVRVNRVNIFSVSADDCRNGRSYIRRQYEDGIRTVYISLELTRLYEDRRVTLRARRLVLWAPPEMARP